MIFEEITTEKNQGKEIQIQYRDESFCVGGNHRRNRYGGLDNRFQHAPNAGVTESLARCRGEWVTFIGPFHLLTFEIFKRFFLRILCVSTASG